LTGILIAAWIILHDGIYVYYGVTPPGDSFEDKVFVWLVFVGAIALSAILYFFVALFLVFERRSEEFLREESSTQNAIIRGITAFLNPAAWIFLQYKYISWFMITMLVVWCFYVCWDLIILCNAARRRTLFFDLVGCAGWLGVMYVYFFHKLSDRASFMGAVVATASTVALLVTVGYWVWFILQTRRGDGPTGAPA
jgi:hypothetical protein